MVPKQKAGAVLGVFLLSIFTLLIFSIYWRFSTDLDHTPSPTPSRRPPEISESDPTASPANLPGSAPQVNEVSLSSEHIGRYEKLEINFQLATQATNLQMPYDANPPPGIQPGIGVSVEAQFTPDNWRTVYRQPAFFYQIFQDEVRGNREWFYPTDRFTWKVRFSPNREGSWQYRLTAEDEGGRTETASHYFEVGDSSRHGFIRVSKTDARYFEFEDGAYFPALGYNLNYEQISWTNPVLDNRENFEVMQRNGIQLVRMWLSQWGIFGPSWNPWNSIKPELHAQYIPYAGLSFKDAYSGSDVSMKLDNEINPCMFLGFMKPAPAVKPNTRYRVRVRFRTEGLTGPRQPESPFGLTAKTGGWLAGEYGDCADAGTGTRLTAYQSTNTSWDIIEGSLNTEESAFLPGFYLTLENVTSGAAFIDYVWIEEDLGDGDFGPNILPKPWMAHHLYFEQRASYAFDKVLELAEEKDIYLRPVLMEKNDWLLNRIHHDGRPILYDPSCDNADPGSVPERCPNNRWFYGNGRQMTKVRWLQRAWWRYVQARWGYSTSIHSWEVLNEGDPDNAQHFIFADEFGKYMHQWGANSRPVSTSFWHSFPKEKFWTNSDFPDVDFADIHMYVDESSQEFPDTALMTQKLSMQIGALQPGGAGKPIVRGEAGLFSISNQNAHTLLLQDRRGVWLHNYLWAQLNPGGMIESYWWVNPHIVYREQGRTVYDHRDQFGIYYRFIKDLPLNNGDYEDAAAVASNLQMRAIGQKDLQHGQAHLWIQNVNSTWLNTVNGKSISPVSGVVCIDGFDAEKPYRVEWWDNTWTANPIVRSETIIADQNGSLRLVVSDLQTDVAVKIIR